MLPSSVVIQILLLSTMVMVAFVSIVEEEYRPSATKMSFKSALAKERSMGEILVEENFNSVNALAKMVERLQQ